MNSPIGTPVEVHFDQNFLGYINDKVGSANYPSLCDTTKIVDGGISSWGIELPQAPTSDIIRYALLLAQGNLSHQSVIQIVGGAGGFDKEHKYTPEYINSVINTYPPDPWVRSAIDIFRAASARHSTIITGGTQVGIMALISSLYVSSMGMYVNIQESLKKFVNFLSEPIQIMEMFTPPQLVHVIPAELSIFPKNKWPVAWEKGPEILAPCTGFVVVPGIDNWGDEGEHLEDNQWWVSYTPVVEKIAGIFSSDHGQNRRVTVVFNGGLLTLGELMSALTNDSKIILINGSGRLADLLTELLNVDWDLDRVDPNKFDKIIMSDVYREGFISLLKRFCILAKKKNTVYSHNLRTIGLKSLIEILLSGIKPESFAEQAFEEFKPATGIKGADLFFRKTA